jgi:hypothetical protein
MKLAFTYDDHHSAGAEWERRELKDWLTDIFEVPALKIQKKCTQEIHQHVGQEFVNDGWALDVRLDQQHQLAVTAMKDDLAFQLQTGNMSRAPYDLLKLQYLYQNKRVTAAALALPTRDAAKIMGENIANAERVCREMKLFDRVITIPIIVVAFQ